MLRPGNSSRPRFSGGTGNDSYQVYTTGSIVVERENSGFDSVMSYADFYLPNNVEDLVLGGIAEIGYGNSLDNTIYGNSLSNTLKGAAGFDMIDGGGGLDVALYDEHHKDISYVKYGSWTGTISSSGGTDYLRNIDRINAEDGYIHKLRNNIVQYVASYDDLIEFFGPQPEKKFRDVIKNFIENNTPYSRKITFNGSDYLVSNRDVYNLIGFDPEKAARHYIEYGKGEGRSYNFNSLSYIASYDDLSKAYGIDDYSGAAHYLINGEMEGRKITFNPLAYAQKYADIMPLYRVNPDHATEHWVVYGRNEGRLPS